jgi:MoaA/NifB/PqqE/SkfB family radical SAM enzyme
MKIIKVEQERTNLLHLTWIINNICTNACSYCPKNLHTGTNHNYEWDNARKFFEYLFERYPEIHCSVAGGEPSVSPFLPELVKTFHDRGHTIGITSNAAKPARYWEEIAPNLAYISFSYHPEFPDPKFIEKAKVASENTVVTTRVMMHPKHWDHCVETFEKLLEIDTISVEIVRIIDWGGESDASASVYTDEQLDWFVKNNERGSPGTKTPKFGDRLGNRLQARFYFNNGTSSKSHRIVSLINDGLTNFYGYECEIGLKSLFIDPDGFVLLGNCGLHGPIGNINDPENIKWPTRSVICTKTLCHCTTDVAINKWEM